MAESPLILELEQVHHCVSLDASEKIDGTKIKWLTTLYTDARSVTNMFEIETFLLQGVLQKVKSLREVKDAKVVQKGIGKSWISIRAENSISTAPKLSSSGVVWLQPTYSEDGVDKVTMLAPAFENFKRFLELVEEEYEIKVKAKRFINGKAKVNFDIFSSCGFMQLKAATEMITERQHELFDLACRYGYYEEPKKISLQELGAKLGISESTAAELLRKAEKKLAPLLNDILKVMK